MKLLLDIGNSRLKIATFDGHCASFVKAIAIEPLQRCQIQLTDVLSALSGPIEACVAVSVASDATNAAVAAMAKGYPIHWIRPTASLAGIKNAYPKPSELGADRWVSMLGLKRHFSDAHPALVLATFGTATTVDTLGPDDEFKGGLILPGVTMMHQALAKGTARLPDAPGLVSTFPTDTVSAIASGVAAAQVGAVMRQLSQVQALHKEPPILCVSGGALPVISAHLQHAMGAAPIQVLPHVVFDGLATIAATIN